MTERVTFFGERGPEQAGRTHRLEADGPEGRFVLLVWTGRPGSLGGAGFGGAGGYGNLVEELRTRVHELGGGILVEIHADSGTTRLHRLAVNGQGDVHRLLRLSPFTADGEVVLEPGIRELQLRRGEHLLVPVSFRAEERMLELRDLLSEMGPDVEAMVLHTLRSPSLETRLGRLEEALELGRSGRSRASWWSRRHRRRERAAARPVPEGPAGAARRRWRPGPLALVLVALALLLILAAGWSLVRGGEEEVPSAAVSADVPPRPSSGAQAGVPEEAPPEGSRTERPAEGGGGGGPGP